MCGRFVMIESEEKVKRAFGIVQSELVLKPCYNICPARDVPVIVQQNRLRSLEMHQWGLIPFWAKDPKPMINARAETAMVKPLFRQAFRKRHCLILASGFYEWRKEDGLKQPYFIRLKDGSPMAFAGLWEEWRSPDGELRRTCAILTVAANSLMQAIHNRMPVILSPTSGLMWLDLLAKVSVQEKLLLPFPAYKMEAWRVSRQVNVTAFDNPDCIKNIEVLESDEKKFKTPKVQTSFFY